MPQAAASRYVQVEAQTATQSELLLALYDALFRFLKGARICFERDQQVRARELLSKSHAILSELLIALDHDRAPELCQNLMALYDFSIARVMHASQKADTAAIGDVIRVLSPLHEAWQMAVPKAAREAQQAKGAQGAHGVQSA